LSAQSHTCRKIGADNTFPYTAFSAAYRDNVNWACHLVYGLNVLVSLTGYLCFFWSFMKINDSSKSIYFLLSGDTPAEMLVYRMGSAKFSGA